MKAGIPIWLITDAAFTRDAWLHVLNTVVLGLAVWAVVSWGARRFERYKSREALGLELAKIRLVHIEKLLSAMFQQATMVKRMVDERARESEIVAKKRVAMAAGRIPLEFDFAIVNHQSEVMATLNLLEESSDRLNGFLREHAGMLNEPVRDRVLEFMTDVRTVIRLASTTAEADGPIEELVAAAGRLEVPSADALVKLLQEG